MTEGERGLTEWPATLDVAAELARGWRPTPLRWFVLKVHGRCDLACDYCYVYEMADQSWRDRPRMMSRATIERACTRIAEHAGTHGLDAVRVTLHGGEPLLIGLDGLALVVGRLRSAIPSGVRLDIGVQTNGTRLDDRMVDALARAGVRVGVSLDGGRAAHDRHRRYPDGRGSYAGIRENLLRLVRRQPEIFSGLLCTIDPRDDPVLTYESLLEFTPPEVDFLLPHGNWSAPPPGRRPGDPTTPYGDWLAAVFDRWYQAPRQETRVRLLAQMTHRLLAPRAASADALVSTVVVVDTDGSIEQVDALRSAYPGAAGTGLNVRDHDFDAALAHPGMVARQIGAAALGDTCRACPVRRICGGGYYPHRYRAGDGFRNPSVYCPDLLRLIRHVHDVLRADLTAPTAC